MDYRKIYDALIENAVARPTLDGYCERHHIIPKSSGGTDDKENMVNLTAREHYIAHKLLYKINPSKENAYALVALSRMSVSNITRCGSRQIEEARKISAELSRLRMNAGNPGKGLFGDKSLRFIGYWVTPHGIFGSTYEAEKKIGVPKSTIQRRCRDCDKVVTAPRLGIDMLGKTWRSQGWYFISKEELE